MFLIRSLMEPPRVTLSRLELVQKFLIAVKIAFSRQRSTEAALTNPRNSEAAEHNRDHAARRLAEHLAHDFEISKHEVTRPAQGDEAEAILAKLLQLREERERIGRG
jgi:hypothetical protein